MYLAVTVERLKPSAPYGRLANFTEVHVAPFKARRPSSMYDDIKSMASNGTNGSIHKNGISNGGATVAVTTTNGAVATIRRPEQEAAALLAAVKVPAKLRSIEHLICDLQRNEPKAHEFRVLSSRWADSQMCDVFVTRHNLPIGFDTNQVFELQTSDARTYCVSVKVLSDQEPFPRNVYATLEMNDILMQKLAISPFERVTLRAKVTPLNVLDKIELLPSKAVELSRARDFERYFKQLIVDEPYPVLINQGQVFRLREDAFVTALIYPETMQHACVDAKGLRDCRIMCSDQAKELKRFDETAAAESSTNKSTGQLQPSASFVGLTGTVSGHEYIQLQKFEQIVDNCAGRLIVNLCLDERNVCRKMGNFIVVGKQKSGKSMICKRIVDRLASSPYHCHSEVFNCAKNKGRKVRVCLNRFIFNESIYKKKISRPSYKKTSHFFGSLCVLYLAICQTFICLM